MERYPSYKDSGVEWIGEIPNHWGVNPLFGICHQTKDKNNGETNVLSLSYGKIIRRDVETNFGLLPESFDSYQIICEGYIVLRLTDLQNDKRSLRVGYVTEKGIITSAYVSIKVSDDNNFSNRFLFYQLYSSDINKVFYSMGGGVRQTLRYDDLKRFPLINPPLPEQHKIVSFLDNKTSLIDKLIETKKRKIELLKEYRTSLINQVVTKGLNPNVEMKDSGMEWVGEIPSHWKVKQLKHIGFIITGNTPPKSDDENYQNGVHLWVKPDELNGFTPTNETKEKLSEKGRLFSRVIPPYSVFVNGIGNIGEYGFSEFETSTNQQINSVTFQNTVSQRFGLYLISSMKNEFIRNSEKVVVPILSKSKQERVKTILPPLPEQHQIVSFLDEKTSTVDKEIGMEVQKIELLKEYRQSLISEVVTGKIKVTSDE